MKTDLFILTATMSSYTIDKWNKLETLIGHRCDSIDDFVEGIHRLIVEDQQTKENALALQESLHQEEIITLRQQLVEKDRQITISNQQLEVSNRENESLRSSLENNKAILIFAKTKSALFTKRKVQKNFKSSKLVTTSVYCFFCN